jgi:hypothetical protein
MKLPKILPRIIDRPEVLRRQLLRREAQIGGTVFGPVPKGHNRQFFRLDSHTWVWYEAWTENGKQRSITTRYEMRPNGVLKVQDGKPYQRLTDDEARNLYNALEAYRQKVGADYQQLLQTM